MKNILFVGAHPDDIEINAGGTINKLVENKEFNINTFVLTHGETLRHREMSESLSILGVNKTEIKKPDGSLVNDYIIDDFTDTKLFQSIDSIIRRLDGLIDLLSIDTIFTHHPFDAHQDHSAVSKACCACARKISNLIFYRPTYPSSNLMVPFNQNFLIKLNESSINKKLEALSAHKSQIEKYGNAEWLDKIKDIAKADSWIYGAGHGYAEVFEISKMIG